MEIKSAVNGGLMAGVGLLGVVILALALLFKIAILVVVFGGAYYLLKHFGVLMAGVPL